MQLSWVAEAVAPLGLSAEPSSVPRPPRPSPVFGVALGPMPPGRGEPSWLPRAEAEEALGVAVVLLFDPADAAGGPPLLLTEPDDPDELPPEGSVMPTPEAAWATTRWIGPGRSPWA